MATQSQTQTEAKQTVFVDTFTNGLLGPDVAMLGPSPRTCRSSRGR